MWVLDAGWLMLNARCITKGMVKSRLTSCLLLIANNCWTRSFALGYWLFEISSVFWLRWGKKTFVEKRFLKWVCMLPYLPLPLLGTVNFRQSVNILCWTICWIKRGRHMILVLVMSLPFRVYYLMRCTPDALWWVIMNSYDSTISCWLYLLFMARSARFVLRDGL